MSNQLAPKQIEQKQRDRNKARFLQELGRNLQKVIRHLIENKQLVALLYYEDIDPLSHLTDENFPTFKEIYKNGDDGIVRIIPIIGTKENEQSILTLRVMKGLPSRGNSEFLDIYFAIEIFISNKQWIIKGDNLRPYAIMGEIQKSLEGKIINGLGKISGSGFECNFFTEEISAFLMQFAITQYN